MKWIYISPHLDDAVLSAGGLLYEKKRAGLDVEIWTMISGFPPHADLSPFAQTLHAQWGIPAAADVVRARRAEDVNAAQVLGVKTVHFDFLDCIYRRGKNDEWLYSDIFVPPHEAESDLPAQIAHTIAARIGPDDQLICQLGIGSHVDHVLVRRAVELLRRPLLYTADIPYLFNSPNDLPPRIVGMKATAQPISEDAVTAWQNAVMQYTSQISSLFDSLADMREKIKQYAVENNGVRLWSPT
jgi:LmbE family N-acetylglucosaminyl deacetylase